MLESLVTGWEIVTAKRVTHMEQVQEVIEEHQTLVEQEWSFTK